MRTDNMQDIIDSRDIMARIQELRCIDERDGAEQEEFDTLRELELEVSGGPEWEFGEELISEFYFVEYCRDMCEDMGHIPCDLPGFIEDHINWEGVARDLREDYVEVDFNGVSYFIKA